MAYYAVGDVQGCLSELKQLLALIRFDPAQDRLWLTGDLVNRGTESLETLRFVRDLGASTLTVLGNHDLHLLAIHYGLAKSNPTLDPILAASDRHELMDWLRGQPLIHHDSMLGFTLVHAGLPPSWDLAQSLECADEVETLLRGPKVENFLKHMYGNTPDRWDNKLRREDRHRYIINAFTRLRFCTADGRLDLESKDAPGRQPAELMPWFAVPGRANQNLQIVFGHWSTLGLGNRPGIYCLDSGCVWGGSLTALRLDAADLSQAYVSLPCPAYSSAYPRQD